MSTAEKSAGTYLDKYFDALLKSYDIMVDAADKAGERGMKVSKALAADIATGQREALELGKKLSAEPTNPAQFYAALLESAMSAQTRALAFTQVAYQEALEASTDAREVVENIVAANKVVSAAANEAAKTWWTANPMADLWRQQMESFAPRTSN